MDDYEDNTMGPETISLEAALAMMEHEYGKENVSCVASCHNGPRTISVQFEGRWSVVWSEERILRSMSA